MCIRDRLFASSSLNAELLGGQEMDAAAGSAPSGGAPPPQKPLLHASSSLNAELLGGEEMDVHRAHDDARATAVAAAEARVHAEKARKEASLAASVAAAQAQAEAELRGGRRRRGTAPAVSAAADAGKERLGSAFDATLQRRSSLGAADLLASGISIFR